MDGKINNYYKNNFLYAGHRMILPETGEKLRNDCNRCKYYITVIGQQESRKICLSEVKAFKTGQKRIPASIEILELILLLGKESLEKTIQKSRWDKSSCGDFSQPI